MLPISLCIIIKNEVDLLERCINSAKNIVNEIIVVDTGSTDGSIALANKLGCSVYSFKWINDFSVARNFSIEKATNDWIFILDADEYITSVDIDYLNEFLSTNNQFTIGEVSVKNIHDVTGNNFDISNISRIFNKNNFYYKRAIHEYIEPKEIWQENYQLLPINITHTGYIEDVYNSKDKYTRNKELILMELEKKKDYYLIMHLAKSYMSVKNYSEAIKHLEEVLNNKDCYKYTYYKESVIEYIKALLNTNQFEKALLCEKYWERCSSEDNYIYFMGHVFMKNAFFEKAMNCFLMIINCENPKISKDKAYYSLAQMFETLGFVDESKEYYNMCSNSFIYELSNKGD